VGLLLGTFPVGLLLPKDLPLYDEATEDTWAPVEINDET
jgi:hypothetical protein